MNTRRIRTALPIAALVALAAIAPWAVMGAMSADAETAATESEPLNLGLLLLVNRLQLTDEQMTEIHGILSELVEARGSLRVSVEAAQAAFTEEMVAFDGTAEELDAAIAAHREEMAALAEGVATARPAALTALGGVLTYEQGRMIEAAAPGLLGSGGGARSLGERVVSALRSRLGREAGAQLEALRQRLGTDTRRGPSFPDGSAGRMTGRQGSIAVCRDGSSGAHPFATDIRGGSAMQRSDDPLEQLLRILEQKTAE